MARIRYHGHNSLYKIRRPVNDLYTRIMNLLKMDELFTNLEYDKLEEEFAYEWKFHIKKELELHMAIVEYNTQELKPQNMVRVYNTNICNGQVFIRSVICPKIKTDIKPDGRLKRNERFGFQINLEVGCYIEDGCRSFTFENLYTSEN